MFCGWTRSGATGSARRSTTTCRTVWIATTSPPRFGSSRRVEDRGSWIEKTHLHDPRSTIHDSRSFFACFVNLVAGELNADAHVILIRAQLDALEHVLDDLTAGVAACAHEGEHLLQVIELALDLRG